MAGISGPDVCCAMSSLARKQPEVFFYSQEFLTKGLSNEEFVRIAYRTLLDRDADAQGFEHWTGKLNDGNSWEFVIEGFIGSQEFSKLCDRYGITPGEAKKVNDVTESKDHRH